MVFYKLVKVTNNAANLAKVINDIEMRYQGLLESIIRDKSSIFISKVWFLFHYFFGIKRKPSTTFYLQTVGQTKRRNRIIEEYF